MCGGSKVWYRVRNRKRFGTGYGTGTGLVPGTGPEKVECYIENCKRERYVKLMQEAAQDKEFMKRTTDAQNAFREVDSEVGGEW